MQQQRQHKQQQQQQVQSQEWLQQAKLHTASHEAVALAVLPQCQCMSALSWPAQLRSRTRHGQLSTV
jgi:hypothetical protein